MKDFVSFALIAFGLWIVDCALKGVSPIKTLEAALYNPKALTATAGGTVARNSGGNGGVAHFDNVLPISGGTASGAPAASDAITPAGNAMDAASSVVQHHSSFLQTVDNGLNNAQSASNNAGQTLHRKIMNLWHKAFG